MLILLKEVQFGKNNSSNFFPVWLKFRLNNTEAQSLQVFQMYWTGQTNRWQSNKRSHIGKGETGGGTIFLLPWWLPILRWRLSTHLHNMVCYMGQIQSAHTLPQPKFISQLLQRKSFHSWVRSTIIHIWLDDMLVGFEGLEAPAIPMTRDRLSWRVLEAPRHRCIACQTKGYQLYSMNTFLLYQYWGLHQNTWFNFHHITVGLWT